jgi:hypothetical protein
MKTTHAWRVAALVCAASWLDLRAQQRGQRIAHAGAQKEQEARAAATALAEGVRPIDMLDSVWIEELSWMEVRDLIKDGKTTSSSDPGGLKRTALHRHRQTQLHAEDDARRHRAQARQGARRAAHQQRTLQSRQPAHQPGIDSASRRRRSAR